jgi:hypothetical protein
VDRAIAGLLFVVAWVSTWRPATDPDQWWHLVFGRSIVDGGVLPRVETLSWWTAGRPVVAHSWLWDVGLVLAHDAAGLTGISVLGAIASGLALAALWALAWITAPGLGSIGRWAVILGAALVVLPLWGARAQVMDLVAVASLTAIAAAWLRGAPDRWLVGVPIVTVLWANVHGSAILAYGLVAIAILITRLVERGRPGRVTRSSGPLLVALVAGGLTAMINPHGPSLVAYPFDPVVASAGSAAIDEWRAPDFASAALLGLRTALAAGALAVLVARRRDVDPLTILTATGFTFLGLGSVRFALIGGPLLVVALGSGLLLAAQRAWRSRAVDVQPSDISPTARAGFVAIAATAVVASLAIGWTFIEPPIQAHVTATRMPEAMVERIRDRCSGRLLNAYDWGGYVAWQWGVPIGAYGNSPGSVVEVQAALETVSADPMPILDDLDAQVVLVKTGGPLAHWLAVAPGWTPYLVDPLASTFVREVGAGCQR